MRICDQMMNVLMPPSRGLDVSTSLVDYENGVRFVCLIFIFCRYQFLSPFSFASFIF